MFFDDHPEFLETSTTAASLGRLNLRHLAIIDHHRDVLAGARVLDIASHDGRWTFAALEAGAAHVTGIEGRPELVENALRTLEAKGIDRSRYDFHVGDVHDVLTNGVGPMDVVMCLGFLYHTLRYPELLAGIRATGARHIIVDSKVSANTSRAVVRLVSNPGEIQSMAVEDRFSHNGKSLVGVPNPRALRQMLRMYGYQVTDESDWATLTGRHPEIGGVNQYATGERITVLAVDVE
jgi:protein-L-isoaspartate O-methyltransferase